MLKFVGGLAGTNNFSFHCKVAVLFLFLFFSHFLPGSGELFECKAERLGIAVPLQISESLLIRGQGCDKHTNHAK